MLQLKAVIISDIFSHILYNVSVIRFYLRYIFQVNLESFPVSPYKSVLIFYMETFARTFLDSLQSIYMKHHLFRSHIENFLIFYIDIRIKSQTFIMALRASRMWRLRTLKPQPSPLWSALILLLSFWLFVGP